MSRTPNWRLPALALAALFFGAAAAQPQAASSVSAPESAQTLLQRIELEIGEARCTADAQCRSLPIGSRACGGPEAYRAYSTQGGKADKLEALAAAHREARAQAQRGRVGICQYLADPGARCSAAGRCELR